MTTLERQLRASIKLQNYDRMLDALKTANPMLQLMCEKLGPAAALPGAPKELVCEYDGWLTALCEVSAAIDAASPEEDVLRSKGHVLQMPGRAR